MNFHLFNPLSLMKSTRLFRKFILLFSLLGLGSVAFAERYQSLFVQTDDTETMNHQEALTYLRSNACLSSNSLDIPAGQIAYVFSRGTSTKPSSTVPSYGYAIHDAWVGLNVDIEGLDANQTYGVDFNSLGGYTTLNSSVATNTQPISGPATIKITIKPKSARSTNWTGSSSNGWSHVNNNSWDFQASEGYVTFRIVGSEQAPSKKFATVIPENASGNIRVVLEQSTDLINWSSANPGVFPPSTAKRFFRVRSVEE